jgi:hypothetical protein
MPLVRPYVRSDGTPVRGHSRWAPGARREMTIFAAFALAAIGFGTTSTEHGPDTGTPRPAVTYPIRFDHADSDTARTAAPQPTVSYPIDLSALGAGR